MAGWLLRRARAFALATAAPVLYLANAALPGGGGPEVPVPKTYYEQGILIRSGETVEPLGPNLMGDSINAYSGDVVFTHTDVAIPGNSALPVAVGRRRALGAVLAAGGGLFGDWDLEIPHLHTVAAKNEPNWYGGNNKANFRRCSQFAEPPFTRTLVVDTSAAYFWQSFWDSYSLYVPGAGNQTLLKRGDAYLLHPGDGSTSDYPVVTKDNWQLSCLPSLDNGPGEGFLARAPDGTTYRFDHMAIRWWPNARVSAVVNGFSGGGSIERVQLWLLPTVVTDRFGNWVRYRYDSADGWRLAEITSSDGRRIVFGYSGDGNRIQWASDGTRTWTYGYRASGSLETVTQPDGAQWRFALGGVSTAPFHYPDPECDGDSGTFDDTAQTGTITHPSGAVGTFVVKATFHGRSNVTGKQVWCGLTSNPVSRYFVSRSLASKTLSGPGMPAMTWQYAYSTAVGSFAPCNGCVATKTVTVTDPLGNVTVDTFGTQYRVDEGLLLERREGVTGGVALRVNRHRYATSGPFPSWYGSVYHPAGVMATVHRPQVQRTIEQDGVVFDQAVTALDGMARPTAVTRSSSLGHSRSEAIVYLDHLDRWVLGQVASRTIAGLTASSTAFDANTALPTSTSRFGKLNASYAYHADGTVASVTDGLNHATRFGNYMRGLPQTIVYADGSSVGATVDNIGVITSVTNEAGTTWTYGYDAMGRLASKIPPGGDATGYYPTRLAFEQVPVAEAGTEAGHWRQTIVTGNAVTVNHFDARWRKRLTTTFDASDPAHTARAQRFDYDPYNRTTFASYPGRSIDSIVAALPGTATTYDALGRPTLTATDSELGTLFTQTSYRNGFQKAVRDARGNETVTGYQVLDEPSESSIAWIAAPEGVNVAIERDVFGKPLSITRGGSGAGGPVGATRRYVYDANQLLCKTIDPETDATIQQHDAANNVAWRALGVALTGTGGCDWDSVSGNSIISHRHDARNRVVATAFGDGSPGIERSYTPDGLPSTVASGGSTWTYRYNNRRLLTGEQLTYGQTYSIGRDYDAHGHLNRLGYPDGAVLSFAPNALGEPTQVSGYASDVAYHPNGMVASYTLASGIVHTLTQNLRGLPFVNRDAGVLQDRYSYDANGNVTAIADQQTGAAERSMAYDGLDRLTRADSPAWGAAAYAYDALDNLRASVVGSRRSTHFYGADNKLAGIDTDGAYTAYAHDARGNVVGRGDQSFQFDLANRMAQAVGIASHAYDGWGRRVAVSGVNGSYRLHMYSQAGQLLFGTKRLVERSMTTRYVYLGGKLIAQTDSVTGTAYAHTDALGSPVALTGPTGQFVSRTRYEPYGATATIAYARADSAATIGFTGHVNGGETRLVYMQQRYYDPVAGRFISVDPEVADVNTVPAFNRYVYAYNNPYRYTDPDGRCPVCVVAAPSIIDAIVGAIATNTGAAVVGVAGGAAIAAAVSSETKPSTLTPGPNAGDSIPARGPGRRFTPDERAQINEIGDKTGCHTCGASGPGTQSGNWIPDHQPPTGLNDGNDPQRLFPHCLDCSRQQGGQVNGERSRGQSNGNGSGAESKPGSGNTTFQGVFQVQGRISADKLLKQLNNK